MTPESAMLLKVTFVLALGLIATRLAGRARASVRHLLLRTNRSCGRSSAWRAK